MSYDFSVRLPIEGVPKHKRERWIDAPDLWIDSEARNHFIPYPSTREPVPIYSNQNITYNVRQILIESTGIESFSCSDYDGGDEGWGDMGLFKDIVEKFRHGFKELVENEEHYKQWNSPNGWGSTTGVKRILGDYIDYFDNLPDEWREVAHFFVG